MNPDIKINEVKRLNLLRILQEQEMTPAELARRIRVERSYISALTRPTGEAGSRNIGDKTIKRLCEALRVAESEFYRFDIMEESDGPRPVSYRMPDEEEPMAMDEAPAAWGSRRVAPVIAWKDVPRADPDAPDWDAPGFTGRTVATAHASGRAFALAVEDDAMWPRFMRGDVIVIDPDRVPPEPGDPVVALVNDEPVFRVYRETDAEVRLEPLNDRFEIRTIRKNSRVDLVVAGVVVEMIPTLNPQKIYC